MGLTENINYHQTLASFFSAKPLFQDQHGYEKPNIRKLVEQPYQQICGEVWGELEMTLTDLSFIEAKCAAKMCDDLVNDYYNSLKNKALPPINRQIIEEFKNFFKEQSHILQRYPNLTFQQAINQPDKSVPCLLAKQALESGKFNRPWLDLKNKTQEASATIFTRLINSDYVSTCAVSPDGHKIISQTQNNILTVWDSETGATMMELTGHSSWVTCCAFSPGGDRIITSSQDSTVKIWDATNGALMMTLTAVGPVREFSLFNNGKQIVTVFHNDKVLQIWDLRTGSLINTFRESFGQPRSCAVTPNGRWIIVGSDHFPDDRYILHVLNAKTGEISNSFEAHSNSINACSCFPDGQKVVSASSDRTVKVWNIKTGTLAMTLEGHTGFVNSCAVSPDGKLIITASDDHSLKLWNAINGNLLTTLNNHSGEVAACFFFPDGKRILSASRDQTIKVWKPDLNSLKAAADNHIYKYFISGRKIISLACDDSIKVWDSESGNILETYGEEVGPIEDIDSSSGLNRILTTTNRPNETNTVYTVWDLETNKPVSTILEDRRPWTCSFSADGRRIITKGQDNDRIKVWDAESGHIETVINVNHYSANFAIFPEGDRILLGYKKNPITKSIPLQIWDINTGALSKTLAEPPGEVNLLSISPDGNRAIAFCTTTDIEINTVYVWDTNTGSILNTFKGDSVKIAMLGSSGAYIADNEFLIVSCLDNTTKFFDIQTGMLLFSLNGQSPFKIFPDRKKIAVSTRDGTLKIWNIKDGSLSGECKWNSNTIYSLAISPGGKGIIVSYDDNTLVLWDVDTCRRIATFVAEVPFFDIYINFTGTIIARDSGNNLFILSPKSFNSVPLITIISEQLIQDKSAVSYKAQCEWCWKWFIPDKEIVDNVRTFISDSTFLNSSCPFCHKPLHFKPLIAEVKRDPEKLKIKEGSKSPSPENAAEHLCPKCGGKTMTKGQIILAIPFHLSIVLFCFWLLTHSTWWLFIVIPAGGFSLFALIASISALFYGRRKCKKCGRTVYILKKDSHGSDGNT